MQLQQVFDGAGNEARTRYLHLGKVALYRMSYARVSMGYITTICVFVKFFFSFFSASSFKNKKCLCLPFAGGMLTHV